MAAASAMSADTVSKRAPKPCGHSQAKIDEALSITGYLVQPFVGWKRGSNENINDLHRQYVPKTRLKELESANTYN